MSPEEARLEAAQKDLDRVNGVLASTETRAYNLLTFLALFTAVVAFLGTVLWTGFDHYYPRLRLLKGSAYATVMFDTHAIAWCILIGIVLFIVSAALAILSASDRARGPDVQGGTLTIAAEVWAARKTTFALIKREHAAMLESISERNAPTVLAIAWHTVKFVVSWRAPAPRSRLYHAKVARLDRETFKAQMAVKDQAAIEEEVVNQIYDHAVILQQKTRMLRLVGWLAVSQLALFGVYAYLAANAIYFLTR